MAESEARLLNAGERECRVPCIYCSTEITAGDVVAICVACGAVHHARCWQEHNGCGSYDCTDGTRTVRSGPETPLVISHDELASATPLMSPDSSRVAATSSSADSKRKWNRASLWAFGIALLGIPLFGLITGLVAVLVACIALLSHRENRRGLPLAVAAMLIGLSDVVGWAFALSQYWGPEIVEVSLSDMSLDPTSLDELPSFLARAMRANVLIEVNAGLGRGGIGSGVVLKLSPDIAYIVTNRHVVDHDYSDRTSTAPNLGALRPVTVRTVNQIARPGVVEWVAPHGVDLAIISTSLSPEEAQEARWSLGETANIGESVFAVGNPHGLGWTHTSGSISQIRRQTRGNYSYRVLQTSAAINPGNSGGGLYDMKGNLLGINTLTTDKHFAEGLGFSITLETLLELLPDRFEIPRLNSREPVDEVATP